MAIDRENLRLWIYEALTVPREQLGVPVYQALTLSNVADWVRRRAQEKGALPSSTLYSSPALEKADEDGIRECIWGLILQGIVVPGTANDSQANLPWFQLTEWGKTCLRSGEYTPYDTALFLSRLRDGIPNLDQIVQVYLKEALNSFRCSNYLSVAVMLGVASERILLVLRDAIYSATDQEDRKKKLLQSTENHTVKRIFQAINARVEPILEQLPGELQDSIGTELQGIFQEVRRTRNDAGHPTGRIINREEAYALLQLFPVYAQSAYALIDWLKNKKI